MTDIEKMTQKSQQAMQAAARAAEAMSNPSVEPEHLTLEILNQDDGIVPRVLESMNVKVSPIVEDDLNRRIGTFPKVSGGGVRVVASNDLTKLVSGGRKGSPSRWGIPTSRPSTSFWRP